VLQAIISSGGLPVKCCPINGDLLLCEAAVLYSYPNQKYPPDASEGELLFDWAVIAPNWDSANYTLARARHSSTCFDNWPSIVSIPLSDTWKWV
jgi:hypothetical protein